MVLVAVVGAFGQRKKQKNRQAVGKTQSKQPMDFWEMLREQSRENVPSAEPEQVFEAEDESIDVVPKQEPVYRFRPQNEGASNIVPTRVEEPKKKERKVLIDGEKFSLRKAVIYSEIMNRKYT